MVLCWVFGCSHYTENSSCSFYRFPKELKSRRHWIKLIRRTDEPKSGARVCSCHFQGGNKLNGPTILPHRLNQFGTHHLTPEKKKKRKNSPKVIMNQEMENEIVSDVGVVSDDGVVSEFEYNTALDLDDEPTKSNSPGISEVIKSSTSLTILETENYFLKKQNEELKLKLNSLCLSFTFDNLVQNQELLTSYTGIPSSEIFMALYNVVKNVEIKYHLSWNVESISKIDQILMMLVKLRNNFPHFDLAVKFNCSKATVSNVVITWVTVLHAILFTKCMSSIPSREKNKKCLPDAFKSFTNCRIIIDCTEIYTAVSRQSMNIQRDTYSSYKHRNTWKALIGIAPNGVVTFVSSLFPGSTSDKMVTLKSGLLEKLVAGDLIIADKGFLIRDILPQGVSLNIPPFLDTPQFTPDQVIQTEVIAKARIHIERAIQRIKCYSIINFIPYTMLKQAETIFQLVSALTNLQLPLIKEIQGNM